MKSFDAVKTMREIRTRLSERYKKDMERQFDDLRRIREKYNLHLSKPSAKQSEVAEDKAKYGPADS